MAAFICVPNPDPDPVSALAPRPHFCPCPANAPGPAPAAAAPAIFDSGCAPVDSPPPPHQALSTPCHPPRTLIL